MRSLLGKITLLMLLSLVLLSKAEANPYVNLISPDSSSSCVTLTHLFKWSSPSPTWTQFGLKIARDVNFNNMVIDTTGLMDTTLLVTLNNYDARYYWKVSATFSNNNTGSSDTWTFVTVPAPPVLKQPANEERCINISYNFRWSKILGAQDYHLQIATDANFTNRVFEAYDLSDTNYTVNLPQFYTKFYWRARASLSTCETDWSEVRTFYTEPEAPGLIAPDNKKKGVPFDVQFRWGAIGSALSYRLEVAKNASFTNPVIVIPENLTNNYSTTFTDYNTEYYWRVSASFSDCQSDWSVTRSFVTQQESPELESPEDGSVCIAINSILSWMPVDSADAYTLQIDTNGLFAAPLITENNISGTSYLLNAPLPLTNFYWRVRVEDSKNIGAWSDTWMFTSTINAPVLTNPADSSTGLELEQVLKWSEDNPGATYRLQISKSDTLGNPFLDEFNLTDNEYTIILPENNASYWWRVSSTFNDCPSTWSDISTFRTLIGTPELISPADESTKQPLNIIFSWGKVDGADTYELHYSTDPEFKNPDGRVGILVNDIKINNFQESTLYYWRVRAKNLEGISHWSDVSTFTTGLKGPATPGLVSPANDSKKIPLDVVLEWSEASGAETYNIDINEKNDFTGKNISLEGLTETSTTVSGLNNYITYYWRVSSVNQGGTSDWTDTWKFRTIALAPTDVPKLWTPVNNSKDLGPDVKLTWYPVNLREGYQLQVATSEDFETGTIFFDENKIWEEQQIIYKANFAEKFYWRVKGWNEAGETPWSETWAFTVKDVVSVNSQDKGYFGSNLYPNPFSSSATLEFNMESEGIVRLEVYTISGSLIKTQILSNVSKGMNRIPLSLDELSSGSYYYVISAGTQKETKQFVISK